MQLFQLSPNTTFFPPVEKALADPNGLLAFGGDLSPDRLLAAYRGGIFPWYSPGDPILWWSPDPRAVLQPEALHISRSLHKFMRKQPFHITLNCAFAAVTQACAHTRQEGTWISPEMITAYCALHEQGHAHSIEVWHNDELVGGLYGIAQGKLFCGESMFSTRDNASKCALVALITHFVRCGGQMLDCQVLNAHTASLGATEVSRAAYLTTLRALQDAPVAAFCWQPQVLPLSPMRER
ncbi:leucyl/phenylalanyl-tRNA--protein transferase [Symbiopectobacterium purcellii]|uniref:Leucyl/phenylalanyl-tRNA--protein transferase n=1 Tax=Symbiopectobacterium purcellii TaxID=2871826 RepID=A0ABX9AX86_9ENTR|nr:leucyl/phenylalanyl-tRNA--protein transferase [Symbiopectobacterium purcellii]QZN98049.1 leucyl/phenylalanyl-tRNA--protein transferase [Symbiopectobacterium purcellii]